MKRNFEPVVKKQQKQKHGKFRPQDEDYFGPRHPPRDDYKRKLKHRKNHYWDDDV